MDTHLRRYVGKETHVTNGCRLTKAEIRDLYFRDPGETFGYDMPIFNAR